MASESLSCFVRYQRSRDGPHSARNLRERRCVDVIAEAVGINDVIVLSRRAPKAPRRDDLWQRGPQPLTWCSIRQSREIDLS